MDNESIFTIIQLTPADDFWVHYVNGERLKVACWALVEHNETHERLTTALVASLVGGYKLAFAHEYGQVKGYGPQ